MRFGNIVPSAGSRRRTYAVLTIVALAVLVFPFLTTGRYPLGLGVIAGCIKVTVRSELTIVPSASAHSAPGSRMSA